MTLNSNEVYLLAGGGMFAVSLLVLSALTDNDPNFTKRLTRVGPDGGRQKGASSARSANAVRSRKDSSIPLLNRLTQLLPNPENLRTRLYRTGKNIALGEYLLLNLLSVLLFYVMFSLFSWSKLVVFFVSFSVGLWLPHTVIGVMGNNRIKKFLSNFPEAIDTLVRGVRSGLPITESIAAVGREMPDPIGIEFSRMSDGVRVGKTLEAAMWEVAQRISTPEYRFLIIAMGIQKETGGNLAETLGNLSELIRKRRQLRLKVKAMSSEAKASAGIIGSLPFIMLVLLKLSSPEYASILFTTGPGKMLTSVGLVWMLIGWGVMLKMINFEL